MQRKDLRILRGIEPKESKKEEPRIKIRNFTDEREGMRSVNRPQRAMVAED
jgi:hypothetical protein